ncbi:hypothetical protein FOH10_01485 [Nocardia otitidiscaviarum]|uniref:Uncharacterized protein n=1 Tax=Nocardia otitidiscaviarum TaxID=1823 RepID=A0A516NFD8_9NOCA|nr:hypothetical protein [Nocardia otitidiscaviarum]MCP9622932.1 hypothetical protein [Nocardia otitidiscaviarum]QDP77616.1 hypothetical protein FOH10_01485 [Nocardia otitidiscaviarum]
MLTGNNENGVLGDGYDRDNVMVPLMTHDWDDGGATLGNGMFGWIGEDARVDPDVGPTDANVRAGQAAFGLTQLLSSTETEGGTSPFERWLDMGEGKESDALGQVNPELTRSMATALEPYVGKMVGMTDDLSGTVGFGDTPTLDREVFDSPIEATRVMTVLNTDLQAGTIINAAALAESMRMDSIFATDEAGDGMGRSRGGQYANRLTWLVNEGIGASLGELQGDYDKLAADQQARYNTAYTAAQIMVGGLATPSGLPVGAMVASASEFVKNDFIEVQPQEAGRAPQLEFRNPNGVTLDYNSTTFGTEEHRQFAMVETLVKQGAIDVNTLPDQFVHRFQADDGSTSAVILKSFTEYNQAIGDMPYGAEDSGETVRSVLTDAGIDKDRLKEYLGNANHGTDRDAYTKLTRPGNLSYKDSVDDVLASTDAAEAGNNTWINHSSEE